MLPEDVFDSVHLAAAEQVARFLGALEEAGKVSPASARLHADHAYLFVEFLANTYPKMPREATERDLWVFLFEYAIADGPFAGAGLKDLPHSVALFFEFVRRSEPVRELEYIRAACAMEDYFRKRLEGYLALSGLARGGPQAAERAAAALEDWWADLDGAMRARGLAPDPSLAGGDETWGIEMGPVEAAVFDAVCLVLAKRARELALRGAPRHEVEEALLKAQRNFMTAPNKGLGRPPVEAVRAEREERGQRAAGQGPRD